MKVKVLASSSLRVFHSSGQVTGVFLPRESNDGPGMARIPAQSKGGPPGLVKPSLADTIKLNVYADNGFMLYVNGRLVAVDPIQFTPHKVVSIDFLTLHEVGAEMPRPNPNYDPTQEPEKKVGGKAGKLKKR